MKEFKIAVTWEMMGYIHVEANSLEEAMEKVRLDEENYPLPDVRDYVDGSFGLSTDDVDEMRALQD